MHPYGLNDSFGVLLLYSRLILALIRPLPKGGAFLKFVHVLGVLSVLGFSTFLSTTVVTVLSIGDIGGADRTFACKSQECLWQDWYILILFLTLLIEYSKCIIVFPWFCKTVMFENNCRPLESLWLSMGPCKSRGNVVPRHNL